MTGPVAADTCDERTVTVPSVSKSESKKKKRTPENIRIQRGSYTHQTRPPTLRDEATRTPGTPENKRKHYDFLINNNDSFDKVKQAASKYINDPSVSESDKEKFRNVSKSIDSYKEEMNKLKNEIPSEEAEKKVSTNQITDKQRYILNYKIETLKQIN